MKGSKMKKMKKRILAALLCTTMMLNTGVSAMADGGTAVSSESAHVHTEECYEKSKTDNLICTKAEAAEGHVHGDTCYEVTSTPELICTQAETAGHTHGDSCMETTKNLICGKEEHTHGGDCYKTETRDVCNDESEEHTCGDGCVETEEVLTCTAEEHTHDDGCYESETNIVCGQNEVEAHTHGEGCYTTAENKVLKCTLEEVEAHTHNDDCYAWEEKLVCTLPETAPAAEQPEKEEKAEEAAEVNLQNDDETGIKVSVKSTSDVIPEDTKVVVASMEMDEEHETALAEAVSEFEVLGYTAYDISLKDAEDEDITLGENKVEVTIDFEELIPEGINAEEVKDVVLVHITTDEEDKLTAETVGTVEITEDKATVEFEADSFSPYVVTYLSETEETVEEVAVEEPVVEDITLTYTSEDEAYTVTVTAAPEVLENVTAFEAVPVTDEEKITALTEQLTAKAAEAQKTSLGFENYEFKFLDAEGNEVSVNGEVKVSLSFSEERIPEAATAENVDAVDAALLNTGTDDKGEAVLEEMNGLVSAEAGAVKEVVYTTEAPEELILAWSGDVYRTLPNYEDDEIVITLAGTEYALQNVVGFNVTPIKEDNEETKEQYAEVAKQLDEKIAEENEAKEEEKEVVGFLAYDITLVDAEGNELEPQGGVKVSMEYKEAAAPEAVAEVEEAEVTIHHFEEDEKGEVKQIVDMVADEAIEAAVTLTEEVEIEKVEFVTTSFSAFTITWIRNQKSLKVTTHYGYKNGNTYVEFTNTQLTDIPSNVSISGTTAKDLHEYILAIEGYKFSSVRLDEWEGTEARYLKREEYSNSLNHSLNGSSYSYWSSLSTETTEKDVYYVYTINSSGEGSNVGESTLDAPEHNKYIEYNEEAKDYTLTLDVTGKKGTQIGADVLLVIDKSGSMGSGSGSDYYNLMPTLKKVVATNEKNVINQLLADDSINSVAAISFSSKKYTSSDISTSWYTATAANRTALKSAVNGLGTQGGTNWQYAMKLAEDKLAEKSSSNNKKYVIFLSDGSPTHQGVYNESSSSYGAITAAINQVNNSTYLKQATIYSVYLTTDTKDGMKSFADGLSNATLIDATESMDTAIQNIVDGVLTPAYENVVIEDTLSENVVFAETEPTFTVTTTKNGTTTALDSSEYTVTVSGKKVTLDLSGVGELDDETVYSISFKVKPSETATNLYIENGTYPNTGDEGTDAEGNTTSSGKPGFYSNATAVVKYKINDGTTVQTANYKKPVVQIDASSITVTPALDPPAHQKTIKKNEDNYTLSLDVTGAVGKAKPIDLLLIVDVSNSMDDGVTGSTSKRYQVVNSAIAAMKSAFLSVDAVKNKDLVINTSVVTFSGPNSFGDEETGQTCLYKENGDAKVSVAWTPINDFSFILEESDTKGGTNWQAGVRTGATQLTTGTGTKKYVVFLTDGDPTFRYNTSGTLKTLGYGDNDNNSRNSQAAINEWNNSSSLKSGYVTSYVVDTNDTKKGASFAEAISATYLKGTNQTAITNNFKKIAEDITLPAYKNVYIQDTLSDYVDFEVAEKLDFKVYAGTTELKEETDYTYTLDRTTKTVRVDLLKGASLTKNTKYTVKFNVVPTPLAYYEYQANGTYNAIGDNNTDAEGNTTSSGKPGFRSNRSAFVGYEVGTSTGLTAEYDHPVVQVDPVFVSQTVNKVWEGSREDSVEVLLRAQIPSGSIDTETGETIYNDINPASYKLLPQGNEMTAQLSNTNSWTKTWNNLPKYYYYEKDDVVQTPIEIHYSVIETTELSDYEATYETTQDEKGNIKTTITNTFLKEWRIVKVSKSDSSLKLTGAQFELVSTSDTNVKYTAESKNQGILEWNVNVKTIPAGTYTLTETVAPVGYFKSEDTWTVTIEKAGAVPKIQLNGQEVDATTYDGGKLYIFEFENEALYALPSTGGHGIYTTMLSGFALMLGAAYVWFTSRREESSNN